MMKLARNAAVIATLALGGCAGTLPPVNSSTISQIQQMAVQACGFLPTAKTVADILAALAGAGTAAIDAAAQAAQSVCSAIGAKSLKRGALKRSIVINGHRVTVSGTVVR